MVGHQTWKSPLAWILTVQMITTMHSVLLQSWCWTRLSYYLLRITLPRTPVECARYDVLWSREQRSWAFSDVCFRRLYDALSTRYDLNSTSHLEFPELIGMFLYTISHDTSQIMVRENFDTTSVRRPFNKVLPKLYKSPGGLWAMSMNSRLII